MVTNNYFKSIQICRKLIFVDFIEVSFIFIEVSFIFILDLSLCYFMGSFGLK